MSEKRKRCKDTEMYVYNIALEREDGKIENDTVYVKQTFIQSELEEFCFTHKCKKMMAVPIGILSFFSNEEIEFYPTLVYAAEEKENVETK